MVEKVSFEKIHAIQSKLIREQDKEIERLRESNRVFVPVKEIKPDGVTFRLERTIDGDVLVIRA